MNKQKIMIARIRAPHGIKGYVKIESFANNPSDIFLFKEVFNQKNQLLKLHKVSNFKNNIFIVKIDDIDSRNKSEQLTNQALYISREALPKITNDQFYLNDLIGLKILNNDQKHIGDIVAVHNFGAGDIIEIKFLEKKNDNFIAFSKENFPIICIEEQYVVYTELEQ